MGKLVQMSLEVGGTVEDFTRFIEDIRQSSTPTRWSLNNASRDEVTLEDDLQPSGSNRSMIGKPSTSRRRGSAGSLKSSGNQVEIGSRTSLDASPAKSRLRAPHLGDQNAGFEPLSAGSRLHSRPASIAYSDDASSNVHSDGGGSYANGGASASTFLIPALARRAKRKARRESAHSSTEMDDLPYCTCCCDDEDCSRAVRAAKEWADMQEDLRLAGGKID